MPVVSPLFIGFIILVGIFTLAIPKARLQEDILLLASLLFYGFFGPEYLVFIITIAGFSYFGAMRINNIDENTAIHTKGSELGKKAKQELKEKNAGKRRQTEFFIIILIIAFWSVGVVMSSLDTSGFVLPLGLSFYSFTAIGYLVDVSRGKYKPEPKFGKYLLFIAYFPHIIQGPFSRYDELAPSLFEVHRFNWERVSAGACRVIWGYAKKVLVADQLSYCVTRTLADAATRTPVQLALALLLYGIQLYADFSGYMDIMCGISQMYGIKLAENFRRPFLAGSIKEFWERTHITFISWMKDYVYEPLCLRLEKKDAAEQDAVSGKPLINRTALLLTWALIGFWHGADPMHIIWGLLNAALIIAGAKISQKGESHLPGWLKSIGIYLTVSILGGLSTISFVPAAEALQPENALGFSTTAIIAVILGGTAILAVDILSEQGKWEQLRDGCPVILKSLVMAVLLIAIVLFAGNGVDLTGTFMYANF